MNIMSLFIYLITFSSSCFCFYLSELLRKYKASKAIRIVLTFIAIIIPCILSALRDYSVGTDVNGYVTVNFFSSAAKYDFEQYVSNMDPPTEIGFALLLYIGILFNSIGLTFFLIQLLIILPIYWTLVKYRNYVSVTLGMATFYFLCYNFSLSGMRGSIAMSFMLYAFYYLQHNNKVKYFLISIIAAFFHSSALLICPLFYIVNQMIKSKHRKLIIILSITFLMLLFSAIEILLPYLINISGWANPRYAYYLSHYIGTGGTNQVFMTDLICKSLLILIITWLMNKTKKKNDTYFTILIMALVGRIFVLFNAIFYESMRIAYYFDLFLILYAGSIFAYFHKEKSDRITAAIIALTPSFLYWVYYIMYIGGYETNNYIFR